MYPIEFNAYTSVTISTFTDMCVYVCGHMYTILSYRIHTYAQPPPVNCRTSQEFTRKPSTLWLLLSLRHPHSPLHNRSLSFCLWRFLCCGGVYEGVRWPCSFCAWLLSFSMMFSRLVCIVAEFRALHRFLWLNNILLHVYAIFGSFIQLLMGIGFFVHFDSRE